MNIEHPNDRKLPANSKTMLFSYKQANQWIDTARSKPTSRRLFGDLWLEGELSMLFAGAGTGKSLLAVQIAESIARGTPVEPLKLESGKQKALYIDCQHSDKQFEMRYARESSKGFVAHHRFSANFLRAVMQIDPEKPEEASSFEEFVADSLTGLIRETGAEVVIIDDITHLCGGSERPTSLIRMMRQLRKMRATLNISLLLLAQIPRKRSSSIAVDDLQSTRALSSFADNVFAIGQSRRGPIERYIRHLRPRSTELIHDESHVLGFRILRTGSFLGFSFTGYSPEKDHLTGDGERARLARAVEIHQLSRDGNSQRKIAEKLGISLGSVNRYLQMEIPEPETTTELPDHSTYLEPLIKEVVDFESLSPEERRAEYLKSYKSAVHGETVEEELPKRYSATIIEPEFDAPDVRLPDNPRRDDPHLAKLEHRIDHMGDDIWIEEERFGKPWIYYKVNKNNVKFRYERSNTSAIFTTQVEDEPP